MAEWEISNDAFKRPIHYRSGIIGRNEISSNAHEIEFCYHRNGSGPEAFGGASEWPNLTIKISFPEGREDLRDAMGERLKQTIDELVEEYGIDI